MPKTRSKQPRYPVGTLQRAIADAAARVAAGEDVEPRDLGGVRQTARVTPDPVATPPAPASRGWLPGAPRPPGAAGADGSVRPVPGA
jgi:hypothetical protein